MFLGTLIVKLVKLLRFEFSLSELFQAYKWYELGHQRGHFASVWQRSLYNVHGLKAQPWWTPKETGYTELVKVSVNFVESLSVSSSKFKDGFSWKGMSGRR